MTRIFREIKRKLTKYVILLLSNNTVKSKKANTNDCIWMFLRFWALRGMNWFYYDVCLFFWCVSVNNVSTRYLALCKHQKSFFYASFILLVIFWNVHRILKSALSSRGIISKTFWWFSSYLLIFYSFIWFNVVNNISFGPSKTFKP